LVILRNKQGVVDKDVSNCNFIIIFYSPIKKQRFCNY